VAEASNRVWTIPNAISVVRLLLVPVFLWLLFKPDEQVVAAAFLLAFIGATDWVDGYIARHWNQGSELGKILDPTADRVLLVAATVALLIWNISPAVNLLVIVVLVREVLIGIAALVVAAMGGRRIDVLWVGKAGTLAIMFALPMLLGADAVDGFWGGFLAFGGWCFAIGGVILSYYAAIQYVPAARNAIREGRAARAAEVQTT